MNCPKCQSKLSVICTRRGVDNGTWRRLLCENCGRKFSSQENIVDRRTKLNHVGMDEVFAQLAQNSIVKRGYISALTGGTYPTREEAEADTIAELQRLYAGGDICMAADPIATETTEGMGDEYE